LGVDEAILVVGALGVGLLDASDLCIGGRTGGGCTAALVGCSVGVGSALGASILGITGGRFLVAHDRGC
jgi:hypothetical protein